MAKKTKTTARHLAVAMARVCAENRCRDVTVLDLRRLSPVTDFFVLATGTSARQMRTVADRAFDAGRDLGERPFSVEGAETVEGPEAARWVLVDYFDVVVQVFTPAGALRQSGEIASRNQRYLKWPMTIGVMAIALV